MAYTCKLEERELQTIGDLLDEALEREKGDGGAYHRRSLVRLALVLSNLTTGYGRWKHVIRDAPEWVYAYLGRPIIDIVPAAKPKPSRIQQKKAARRSPEVEDE